MNCLVLEPEPGTLCSENSLSGGELTRSLPLSGLVVWLNWGKVSRLCLSACFFPPLNKQTNKQKTCSSPWSADLPIKLGTTLGANCLQIGGPGHGAARSCWFLTQCKPWTLGLGFGAVRLNTEFCLLLKIWLRCYFSARNPMLNGAMFRAVPALDVPLVTFQLERIIVGAVHVPCVPYI